MRRAELFRAEALRAQRTATHGEIVLARPPSFAVWTLAALFAAGALGAFLLFGTYTAHATLRGRLVPVGGIVTVHAPQAGIVTAVGVAEGQPVEAGERLFVVSSERFSAAGATERVIVDELRKRLTTLHDEAERLGALDATEQAALRQNIAAARRDAAAVDEIVSGAHERLAHAEQQAARYAALAADGFVAREQLLGKREEVAEQRLRVQQLERERRQAELRVTELESELVRRRLESANRAAELARAIAATRQELTEAEARRSVDVVAPTSGIATGVAAHAGQVTDSGRPLVSIVPADAPLEAELLAPSRAVGFVRAGDAVLLRYQAYPYQKFGHHRGTVVSVSRAPFAAAELAAGGAAAPEPLYRLTIALPSQTIDVYGTPERLKAGMLVEADVLQETRRLYEWVLEPLYALRARRRDAAQRRRVVRLSACETQRRGELSSVSRAACARTVRS